MTLMLTPVRFGTYVATPSGNSFTSDQNKIINVSLDADVVSLQAAGCIVLTPPPTGLLGKILQANFNTTADQLVAFNFLGAAWRVKRIVVFNTSVNGMGTAVGGFYTAASKGGTAVVANSQVYTGLTNATTALELTLAVPNQGFISNTPLYFSLTTAQGAPALADIYVYGDIYS